MHFLRNLLITSAYVTMTYAAPAPQESDVAPHHHGKEHSMELGWPPAPSHSPEFPGHKPPHTTFLSFSKHPEATPGPEHSFHKPAHHHHESGAPELTPTGEPFSQQFHPREEQADALQEAKENKGKKPKHSHKTKPAPSYTTKPEHSLKSEPGPFYTPKPKHHGRPNQPEHHGPAY